MKRTLITLLICATALLWTPFNVKAFGVTPATVDLAGDRGDVLETSFTIVNESAVEQIYYLSTIKFEPINDSNSPRFIPPNEDHSGFPEWIGFEQPSFAVSARTKVDVPVTVAIPADVAAGGYYAAVLVSTTPTEVVATNGASLNAQTAVLLFLTVEGETNESLALLSFNVEDKGVIRNRICDFEFDFSVQNQGNVHVVPTGRVLVQNLFGQTVGSTEINTQASRVLPLTTRTFEGAFETPENMGFLATAGKQLRGLTIGPTRVSLELTYGASEQVITQEMTLWVIPVELLILAFGAAAFLLIVWKVVTKKRK